MIKDSFHGDVINVHFVFAFLSRQLANLVEILVPHGLHEFLVVVMRGRRAASRSLVGTRKGTASGTAASFSSSPCLGHDARVKMYV